MRINRQYLPFFVAGLVILGLYAIVVAWLYATGNWGPAQDSNVTELGVCVQDGVYERATAISEHVTPIYACGQVKGTTNTHGALYLFQNRTGEVIEHKPVVLSPGVFFIPFASRDALEKGDYRLEFYREQKTRAEADFTVQ